MYWLAALITLNFLITRINAHDVSLGVFHLLVNRAHSTPVLYHSLNTPIYNYETCFAKLCST